MNTLQLFSVGAIFCVVFASGGCAQDASFESDVREFQHELNTQYADSVKSPLTDEDKQDFTGLPFYAPDEQFRVEAQLMRLNGRPIEMPTTTDRIARYQPYGKLLFEIGGDSLELTVYQPVAFPTNKELAEKPPLFLPYTDLTNGNETYGAGRYIDIERQEGETWMVDFNQSYNPYCAYNTRYSCPIPPGENHLDVRIEAGVRYEAHY